MTDHSDFIARIEAATGPSRELDAEIARATGWQQQSDPRWGIAAPHWYKDGKAFHELAGSHWYSQGAILPPFTASIDAALTIVPEGCSFDLSKDHEAQGGKWFCLIGPDGGYHHTGFAYAATPALALCAAALKAKGTDDAG